MSFEIEVAVRFATGIYIRSLIIFPKHDEIDFSYVIFNDEVQLLTIWRKSMKLDCVYRCQKMKKDVRLYVMPRSGGDINFIATITPHNGSICLNNHLAFRIGSISPAFDASILINVALHMNMVFCKGKVG